ncbi:DUF881 domain-containing protein [Clostridium tarantellae]|uniref:DUF881 domain-containing protein n=1 Tax=Clostridium tarantellae TaxID=39493 RepID=A0A6I1MND6_9CLOT|nr:DUF881 domain-containing protein [Clostridium tarantellae]MPQ43988.1 DUF881 domain-containing protein [Clostridium tarantellae]
MRNTESTIFIFIASIIAGVLISMNIGLKKEPEKMQLTVAQYQDAYNKRNKLYNEISKLKQSNRKISEKIKEYSKEDEQWIKIFNNIKLELSDNQMLSGFSEAKGSGLKIILKDGTESFEGEVIDDFLKILRTIHDDDMIKVVNELKLAGAEAISLNNQRIVYNTEIYCGGQFLRTNGVKLPAPFYVNVIGDPDMLENNILREGSYIKTLKNRGINIEIIRSDNIIVPAYLGDLSPKYMSIYQK